jgi:hypothetical protein
MSYNLLLTPCLWNYTSYMALKACY